MEMDAVESVASGEKSQKMEDQSMSVDKEEEEKEMKKSPKPARQRKKRLINQLREQMEFYFSAANLSKNRSMARFYENGPYISLATFCNKFNKIRAMTDDVNLLRKAVEKSAVLTLSEDGLMVKRKEEVTKKANETECTIYVENIPAHVDHDWVRQIFSQYGVIDYISLPRYKHSCRPKGFAFVEFQSPEMADLALESFGAEKCRIPTDIDPAQLQSIKNFEQNSEPINSANEAVPDKTSDGNKTVPDELEDANNVMEDNVNVKRKRTDSEEGCEAEQSDPKKIKPVEGDLSDTSKDGGGISASEEQGTGEKKSKKKKRKRSKKVKGDEIESIYLKVMSKKEWKTLRNKYLNMQRENMRNLKQKVREIRDQRQSMYSNYRYENPNMATESSAPFQKHYNDKSEEQGNKNKSTKPDYIPNAIIKISFEEPPQDPKKLRETIRKGGGDGVAYVDASAMERDVFVRFLSEEAAGAYKKSGCWSRMEILSGTEEEEYWNNINICWSKSRGKRNKQTCDGTTGISNQERGREKLLLKAFRESQNTKPSQHIVFED
ncbi:la-related protein 7-like [Penaeus japonicus]|uniref:la-related protein 7-like n=1 Tax=Penaeus japonicus TaxID=27405 RepID=UPI001C711B08|nr:la-related protein 7-like [Penaeus japonicus]